MIKKEELYEAGKCYKTHGVKGELSCSFNQPIDLNITPYIVVNLNGVNVPFFIETFRTKSATSAIIKFKNIDSENEAQLLVSLPILLMLKNKQYDEEDEVEVHYFINFKIHDTTVGEIGVIVAIDETTSNTLFCVENMNNEMFYIPVAEEYFVSINEEDRIIMMDLPVGLLDVNK